MKNQDSIKAFLSERLGVAFELQQENVSPQCKQELSAEVRKRLHRKLADEFALYESIA